MRTIFQTIDPPAPRITRWLTSAIIHIAALAFLLIIPIVFHEAVKDAPEKRQSVTLYEPKLSPPAVKLTLPRNAVRITAAKVTPPKIVPPVKLEAKLPPPPPPPVPRKVAPIPQPEAPKIEATHLDTPKIDIAPAPAPAPKPVVKTGVFAAAAPAPMGPKASANVRLGGFGDPNGVPASSSSSTSMIAKVGSFDLPQGSGHGGGEGIARVAAAGFGDGGFGSGGSGGGNGPGGSGKGVVKSAGFGDSQAAAPAVVRTAAATVPAQTPVEILSKPRPVYTAEAREKKIEGEVQLEVMFSSSGAIHVVRVVRGLGFGLDESAVNAASQIRFRPGTRAGAPVDMKGIVHIVFELS